MKSICITGAAQSDLQTVTNILQQAGMKQPKPARYDAGFVDIKFWHEQVMTLAAEDSGVIQPVSNPGRLWEQLASDIFVANINSETWGWADAQSTWFLDYWLDFEPHLNFILVCVSPQQMLASIMTSESETDTISVEMLMNAWQAHHQELLRFHHRNPQRSLLVDFSECVHYPGNLIKRCAEQWRLPLIMPVDALPTGMAYDFLAIYLAQQLCQEYPEVASLRHELAATIAHLSEGGRDSSISAPDPAQIIANYRVLRERSTEIGQIQAVEEELATLKIRFDETLVSHALQQKDNEEIFNEATKKIESLQLQLRLTQEELDAVFLKYESQQTQIGTLTQTNVTLRADGEALAQEKSTLAAQQELLKQEVTAASKARDEQSMLAGQYRVKIDKLTQERDSHASQAAERQAQIDALTQTNATLTEEKSVLAVQHETLKQEVAALSKAREEQSALANQRLAQIEALAQERDSYANQAAKRQAQIDTLTQANTALNAEKEALIQEKAAMAAQQELLKQEVAAVSKARDEQSMLAEQYRVKIDKLTQERDSHASQAAQKQTRIDALSQEISTLKADQEATVREKSALVAQLEVLNQEVATISKARDELDHLLSERQAQLEQLDKTQVANSELLLLELHQAHLESEQYFQQHQETLNQLQAAEARWQRLLRRNPAYLDYETIEILPRSSGEDDTITWRLTNFSAAGCQLPVLEFKTPLEQGIAGYIFRHSEENSPLFRHWPASANQQDELILVPVGARASSQQCIENLFDLAASDWGLLKALTSLLIETLASPAFLEKHADIQPGTFRAGLEKFNQILQKFPATLRYDQVQLKQEQINPGYEHLWFHFVNFSFDGKRWPEFEFRLACANAQPDQFGSDPRLEFPEAGSKALFKDWFVDSHDDYGPKLELRFAQPDAMDIGIWWRLTDQDRFFLAILIKRLPFILKTLQSAGGQLKRSWADWSKLIGEIQRIFAIRTAVSQIPEPVRSIQPAAAKIDTSLSNAPKPAPEPTISIKNADRPLSRLTAKSGTTKSTQASKKREMQK